MSNTYALSGWKFKGRRKNILDACPTPTLSAVENFVRWRAKYFGRMSNTILSGWKSLRRCKKHFLTCTPILSAHENYTRRAKNISTHAHLLSRRLNLACRRKKYFTYVHLLALETFVQRRAKILVYRRTHMTYDTRFEIHMIIIQKSIKMVSG